MRPASGKTAEFLKASCHHFATLWRFELTTGDVLRYTNHDREIEFDGELYSPAAAPRASAAQEAEGLQGQTRDLEGIIEDDSLSFDNLRAGLLRNAELTEYAIDWRYPWAGALSTRRYFVGEVSYGGNDRWNAQLNNPATRLQVPVGAIYGRACRFSLGDANCGINVNAFKSSILTVSDVSSGSNNTRTRFSVIDASYFASQSAEFASFGFVEWVSGENVGLKVEVLKETRPTANEVNFQLSENAAFDVSVGDKFRVTAGCDRTIETCENKFNNLQRFGGFPDIPGIDRLILTPDVR